MSEYEIKCPRCDKMVLLSDIRWNGKYIKCCKECDRIYGKKYRSTEKGKLVTYRVNLKQKFGITPEERKGIIEFQLGGCAICKLPFNETRKSVIDHNHKTGKMRDILCYACNSAIGLLNEDEDLFFACLEYLKRHAEKIA